MTSNGGTSSSRSAAAAQPIVERLKALILQSQFAWFLGHLITVLASARYHLSVIFSPSNRANFNYRLALVGTIISYGIVLYKSIMPRVSREGFTKAALRGPPGQTENYQYLLLAIFWLLRPAVALALLPYAIYSFFHVLSYTRAHLIPELSAASQRPNSFLSRLSQMIQHFVRKFYEPTMIIVSKVEVLAITSRLALGVLFRRTSLVTLLIYATFLRFRWLSSSNVRTEISNVVRNVDHLLANPSVPEPARSVWRKIKELSRVYLSGQSGVSAQASGMNASRPASRSASAAEDHKSQ